MESSWLGPRPAERGHGSTHTRQHISRQTCDAAEAAADQQKAAISGLCHHEQAMMACFLILSRHVTGCASSPPKLAILACRAAAGPTSAAVAGCSPSQHGAHHCSHRLLHCHRSRRRDGGCQPAHAAELEHRVVSAALLDLDWQVTTAAMRLERLLWSRV